MREIKLLKKKDMLCFIPIFYKGNGANLVELTNNGTRPLLLSDEEYLEALKRGFGNFLKHRWIKVTVIPDVEQESIIPEPQPPVIHPEPKTVIKDETLVVKSEPEQQPQEPIPEEAPKKTTSRKSGTKKK